MVAFEDGSGGALYHAGGVWTACALSLRHIAKWNGSSWADLAGGIDGSAYALAGYDDGSGPALYVGGSFTEAGGVAVDGLAKWSGTPWSAVNLGPASVV